MRPTKTLLGKDARKAVLAGVNAIWHPVRVTLGPQAKKALLYRTYNRGSRIVDDGYMVAECQEPQDPFVRMVAQAFREGTKRTNERVGDGTTTTTVIGGQLMNDVMTLLGETSSVIGVTGSGAKGMGVMTLRSKIIASAQVVKEAITAIAKKIETIEELEQLAIISADDVEVGKVVAKMAWEVGVDGHIDVVEGYKGEIETNVSQGFRFPAKVPGKIFLNNPARYEMLANDCAVLITNYSLENPHQLAEAINPILKETPRLIIVSPKFSDEVLLDLFKAMYVIHPDGTKTKKGGVDIFPVHTPALRTEQFEDLAIYCGARFIDKAKGHTLKGIKLSDAGFMEKLVVKDTESREDAVATGGRGSQENITIDLEHTDGGSITQKTSAVKQRIDILKDQLKETQQEQFKKLLERRIASMASSVGVIRVGDSTQASSLYRKLKIEDAVYACKAALRGGYVKGGGLCLKDIADKMPETDILKNALLAPYNQIQSSVDGGIDITDDVIDPAEMIYYAVEHATQIVANLATVEVITPELEETNPGDGYMTIAKAINEYVISNKLHLGQIQANQVEEERDRMGGLTIDEKITLDNG